MATRYGYARALRTLGQALEQRGIDLFDVRCDQHNFYLQCADPAPPYLSLVELHYSLGDLNDLDLDARSLRDGSFKFANFDGLPEVFRAVGRRLEEKEGQLVRLCSSASSAGDDIIRLEYQTRDGWMYVEDLLTTALGDYAMRMYKERLRIPDSRLGNKRAPA